MVPSKYNLTIYRGRDFVKDFTFKDDNDVLIDISTWILKAEVRLTACQDGVLLATFAIVVDTVLSTIVLTLTDTETLLIPVTGAYWDLLVTIGTNDQTYILGKVKANCTVTEVN